MRRLAMLFAALAAILALSLVGGTASGIPKSVRVAAAYADDCDQNGEWPNCATMCAITGNNCDAASDGDTDYGWICATTGNDCGDGGECGAGSSLVGTNGDGAVYYLDDDGAFHWTPDPDTFNALGFSWGAITWCDSLPDPPVGLRYPSVDVPADGDADFMAALGPGIYVPPPGSLSPHLFASTEPKCTSRIFGPVVLANRVTGIANIICANTTTISGDISVLRQGYWQRVDPFSKGGDSVAVGIGSACYGGTQKWTITIDYTATGRGGSQRFHDERTLLLTC